MLDIHPIVVFFFENDRVEQTKIYHTATLGRGGVLAKPSLRLPHPFLKPMQGTLVRREQGWFYEDTSGLATTWVNGHLLQPNYGVAITESTVITITDKDDPSKRLTFACTQQLERAHIPWQAVDRSVLSQPELQRDYIFFDAGTHVWAQPRIESASAEYQQRVRQQIEQESNTLRIHLRDVQVGNGLKKRTLLKDVDAEVQLRDVVLVLGSSGAGKSTFLNAVSGYEPANAEVTFCGLNLSEMPEAFRQLARHVPQHDHLRPRDTVRATLKDALNLNKNSTGLNREQRNARVQEVLELFNLAAEANNMVAKLSGGQRKRLSIAVEYIANPQIFFLDEPDSGLDSQHAQALMRKMREIADQGRIVMVISHNADQVAEYINKVLVLGRDSREQCGTAVFYGTKEEAFRFFNVESFTGIVQQLEHHNDRGEPCADVHIDRYRSRLRQAAESARGGM